MWLKFSTLLILLLAGTEASSQVFMSGDLTAHIDSLVDAMPGATPSGLYLQPNSSSRDLWRSIIRDIMAGDYETAHSNALTKAYRVVVFTDTGDNPGRICILLERTPEATSRYWGTFVFDPSPVRGQLAIQCPHARYDSNTGKEGFRVFQVSRARAFLVNGVHRCNGETATPCDGTTTACTGVSAPYPYSDQAHVVLSTFQLTTEEMLAVYPELIVLQPHGFAKGEGDPDVIMSNGSTVTPPIDYLAMLRDNLLAEDATLTFKIAHLDDWTRLIARTNVQGRLINGSSDPCGTYATTNVGRFLHLEQARPKLRDTESDWYKLANAVAATFPPTENVARSVRSGEWWDDFTWSTETVPTASADVQIVSGHTVSIEDASAECRSLSFEDATASLVLTPHSQLDVYGDFAAAGGTHDAFGAGWSETDATLRFTGAANQRLLGWSPGVAGTSFRDAVIEKSGGRLSTEGGGMRLDIQSSLDVRAGIMDISSGDTLAISGELILSGGTINNLVPDAAVIMADGATIVRSDGALLASPSVLGSLNVRYENTVSPLLIGPELPAELSTLSDLLVGGSQEVFLSHNITVNGTVLIAGGGLSTDSHILSLGEFASIDETSGSVVEGYVTVARDIVQAATEDFGHIGLSVTANGSSPGPTSVIRVTGEPQDLGGGRQSAERYFDVAPMNNAGLAATLRLSYSEGELNGLDENLLSLFSSDDGGSNWVARGGVVDPVANTVTLSGVDSFSRWTLGERAASCCEGRVGDANGSGVDEPSIGDISAIIDAKFISVSCDGIISCVAEADINQSGGLNPSCDDITIGDLAMLIDYLFVSGSSSVVLPDCM